MEQKIRGLLAYLFAWVGGLIILFAFKDNNEQTKFNCCQSIVSSAAFMIIAFVIGFIPFIGWIIAWAADILMVIIAVIGMIRAYNEQDFEVPVIANITKSIFKSVLEK